ncbi:hypothetical protein B0H16DRAFT_1757503 [Mycena metata]|uniref:Uncharacterized protein n=1 Tax=Mycena metata TaxID=1033252 RepID=A0AAD7IF16_9AGAR|nr:hypothetical protein B0H16DRAFT_1757503 [Mycena metata]
MRKRSWDEEETEPIFRDEGCDWERSSDQDQQPDRSFRFKLISTLTSAPLGGGSFFLFSIQAGGELWARNVTGNPQQQSADAGPSRRILHTLIALTDKWVSSRPTTGTSPPGPHKAAACRVTEGQLVSVPQYMSTATTRPPFFCTADLLRGQEVQLPHLFPRVLRNHPRLWSAVEEFIEANPPVVAEENVMGFVSDDGWDLFHLVISLDNPDLWSHAHTRPLEHRDSKGPSTYDASPRTLFARKDHIASPLFSLSLTRRLSRAVMDVTPALIIFAPARTSGGKAGRDDGRSRIVGALRCEGERAFASSQNRCPHLFLRVRLPTRRLLSLLHQTRQDIGTPPAQDNVHIAFVNTPPGADAPRKLSAIVVLPSLAHSLSHSCWWRCSSRAEWAVGAFCFLVCPVCFVVEKWERMRDHRAADALYALPAGEVAGERVRVPGVEVLLRGGELPESRVYRRGAGLARVDACAVGRPQAKARVRCLGAKGASARTRRRRVAARGLQAGGGWLRGGDVGMRRAQTAIRGASLTGREAAAVGAMTGVGRRRLPRCEPGGRGGSGGGGHNRAVRAELAMHFGVIARGWSGRPLLLLGGSGRARTRCRRVTARWGCASGRECSTQRRRGKPHRAWEIVLHSGNFKEIASWWLNRPMGIILHASQNALTPSGVEVKVEVKFGPEIPENPGPVVDLDRS